MANKSQYLTWEFWESFFKEKGFTRQTGFSVRWRFEDGPYVWWAKNNFVIGIEWDGEGRRPKLALVYNPESADYVYVEKEFEFSQVSEILSDIEALSNPTLLPCCIGDHWMGPIIEAALIHA